MRTPTAFDPSLLPSMTSDAVDLIFSDYIAAHAEIENIAQNREVEVPIKDKNNPGNFKGKYKFQYATLAGILHHIRPALTKHGVWFVQFIRMGEMVTRIIHKSGQWIEAGHLPMPNISGSPQDIGSIVSYFKRYSLSMAFGLASEEDNDGEVGDRQVEFRSRGTPRDRAPEPQQEQRSAAPATPEPEEGWAAWSRGFIEKVNDAATESLLDDLIEADKQFINGSRRINPRIYEDIGKQITTRRSILGDEVPF